MDEPIEMTSIRNHAAQQDAGPGSGILEARAVVGYVDGLIRDLGSARALVERAKGRDESIRREVAESKQIRASADNVRYNAQQRELVYWRDAFNARTFVKRLLEVADDRVGYSKEDLEVIEAAKDWLEGPKPVDPNAPEPQKMDTT